MLHLKTAIPSLWHGTRTSLYVVGGVFSLIYFYTNKPIFFEKENKFVIV